MDFLKEFSRQISGKGRTSERAREGAEAARLGTELRSAQESLDNLYGRYGRACYDAQEGREVPGEIEELAMRIRAARLQVAELTAERDAALEWKRCANCGMAFAREARFCSACGRKLPEESPRPEPVIEGEYCPACGAKLEPGDKRCPVCSAAPSARPAPAAKRHPAPARQEPEPEEPDGTIE